MFCTFAIFYNAVKWENKEWQTYRQTDRQADRKTDRQTERQTLRSVGKSNMFPSDWFIGF